MKNRKGQKSIDEGRAAIQARADEIAKHQQQVDSLTKQLGSVETEESAAAEKAKREAGADVWKDIAGPAGAGVLLGGGTTFALNKIIGSGDKARANALIGIGDEIGDTRELTNSAVNRARAVGAAKAAERYAPTTIAGKTGNFLKRAGTYAVPTAFIANEYRRYENMANDENLPWEQRQAASRMANMFLGGFTGVGVEGAARFLNRKEEPGVGRAMMRIEAARDLANRFDAKDLGVGVEDRGSILQAGPRNALNAKPKPPTSRTIEAQATPQIENRSITAAQNYSTTGDTGDMGKSAGKPPTKINTQQQPVESNPATTKIANFSNTGESAELGKDPGKPATKIEPQKTPQELPYRDRLRMAVESVGAKPGRTKQANYEAFKRGLTEENLPKVAEALSLPQGASKATILQRAREMLRTSGKGSFFLPILAGGLAYQMAGGSPAEASVDGTTAEPSMGDKLLAGGTAAGVTAGAQQLMSRIPPAAGAALGMAGGAMTPFAAADTSDMMTQDDINVGRNWLARNIPASRYVSQDMANAYGMAQVPSQNPERQSMGPRVQGNAPDFNTAYQEFLSILAERD